MRWAIWLAMLLVAAMILTGCAASEKWPRLVIEPTDLRVDEIGIPLRDGYSFAEVPFDVEETDQGYDIVIHAVRGDDERGSKD